MSFFLVALAALALLPLTLVLGLLVILALRHDDDVDGYRAPAIYGSLVAFVAFFMGVFASSTAAASIAEYSRDEYGGGHDSATSALVASLIVVVVAAGLLAVHRPLFAHRHGATGAAKRVFRAYALVTCLAAAIVAVIGASVALYNLYGFIVPDTAHMERGDTVRTLAPSIVLFASAGILWLWHWREAGFDRLGPPSAADVP